MNTAPLPASADEPRDRLTASRTASSLLSLRHQLATLPGWQVANQGRALRRISAGPAEARLEAQRFQEALAALELAAFCAGWKEQLEQLIPELRKRYEAVERGVPPERVLASAVVAEVHFPFSLRGLIDVAIRESLSGLIADLHALATANEEAPFGERLSPDAIWPRFDPLEEAP
jgi:hypothetical protein